MEQPKDLRKCLIFSLLRGRVTDKGRIYETQKIMSTKEYLKKWIFGIALGYFIAECFYVLCTLLAIWCGV